MKLKKIVALILCAAMIGSTFSGCGAFSKEQAKKAEKEKAGIEIAEVEETVTDLPEKAAISPISDAVNTTDDRSVNYDTNFVSGADSKKTTSESEQVMDDEDDEEPEIKDSGDDIISSLIENNKKEELTGDQDFVEEKEPDDSNDSDGDLDVPFDIAYPDIFNSDDIEFADNAILVKVDNTYSDNTVTGLQEAKVGKMEVMFEMDEHTWYIAYLLKGADVHEAMEKVRMVPGIETAEYNFKYETAVSAGVSAVETEVSKNDRYGHQWPKDHFGIREGWGKHHDKHQTGGGSSSVVVAVIDTGVDYTHPDLKSNMWVNMDEIPDNGMDDDGNGYVDDYYGIDMTQKSGSGMDDNGHGTHVAGIVGAVNNTEGIVGYAYNSKIMTVKAGDASGYFLQNNIAEAIIYAYSEGADVINMSFGGTASSIAVQDALSVAYSRCVLVASAGNDGAPNEGLLAVPNYPAAFSYVLGVMSVDQNMTESTFTNYDVGGFNSVEYEVYAPGEQMVSTLPGGKYGTLSGTSMAAPVVAAQAALLRSYYSDPAIYPTKFIYGQIVGTADEGVQCLNPDIHGLHNVPGVVNFYDSMNELPTPDLGMSDYTLFDTAEFIADTEGIASGSESVNNGDGIVDSGEIIALGFTLKNRWGMAENVKVRVDAISEGGVEHPYVTFLNNNIEYGPVGTYSENDSGKIFDETSDGQRWIGWENPFYIKISEKCPNEYTATINLTITYENGLNPEDTTTYTTTEKVLLKIRRGTELPNKVTEDMTLTKDNYYIVPNSMIIMDGVTVTVEEGTQIQFWCSDPEDAYADTAITYLNVAGNFICKGTEEEPVEIFPSEWMGQYCVEIYTSGNGSVEMAYTHVTNPYLTINKAENCEFDQNFKDTLYRRYLSNGQVDLSSCDSKLTIKEAKDSVFYKLGGGKYWQAQLYGSYERCIFVDSNINYQMESAVDCVFYGNNNFWDSTDDYASGTSSIVLGSVYNYLNVEKVFRNTDTGKTYVIIEGGVNKRSMMHFIEIIGGQLACFNSVEELEFVFKYLEANYHSSKYNCGLYIEDDILYNHDGTEVNMDSSSIVLQRFEEDRYVGLAYQEDGHYDSKIINIDSPYDYSRMIVEIPGEIYITNIALDAYVVNLDMDSSHIIDAVLTPATADQTTLVYTSEDESIAVVDENGKITAAGVGTTNIRVYAPDYAIYNYVTVNVVDVVELEALAIKESDWIMDIHSNKKLNLEFTPGYTTKRDVTYTSSDENVVTVNEKGILQAVGEGTATITVTGYNGLSASVEVTVIIPATAINFEKYMYVTSLTQEDGMNFYPVITPSNATYQDITWESSNPEVCYVNEEGILVKEKGGIAVLQASLAGVNLSDTITVTITEETFEKEIVKIIGTGEDRIALTGDGELWKWGGSLAKAYPLSVESVDAKDIMIGQNCYYVLAWDGNVYEYNIDGVFTQTKGLSNIQSLGETTYTASMHYSKACFAITEDGGVWAWGYNHCGALGNGALGTTVYIPVPVDLPSDVRITKVVSSEYAAVFLAENGDVYVSGGRQYTIPEKISSGVKDIYGMPGDMYRVILDKGMCADYIYGDSSEIRLYVEEWPKVEQNQIFGYSFNCFIQDGKVYYEQKVSGASESTESPYTEIKFSEEDDAQEMFMIGSNLYVLGSSGRMYAYGPGANYVLGNGNNTDAYDELVNVYFGVRNNGEALALQTWNGEYSEVEGKYYVSDPYIELDFNQALIINDNYGSIRLSDSSDQALMFSKEMNLDKLQIIPRADLENGETYTLTLPAKAFSERGGTSNEQIILTFTYHNPEADVPETDETDETENEESIPETEEVIHDAVVDEDKMSERHVWTSEEVMDLWNEFVADGYNTRFYSNVILNRLNDDDTTMWLRFSSSENGGNYDRNQTIGLGGNYWGTTDSFLINKQILDFDDYQSLYDINEGAILTEAPEDTFPFVVNAYLEVDGEVVDQIGNDLVTFVVEFNRDMDTEIDLTVCFGSDYPYKDYTVKGTYESPRVWKGDMQLSTMIENGYQYWSVSNGKAAGTSLKLYEDWGRFPFKIDTSSAQALIMQGEATETGIHLIWEQDDFTTLAGYNVYRATKEDGQYTRINTTVIPADTKEWFDDTVEPGQKYYYNFTVVESDMTESEPSGKVQITAWDTMAPNIYHSPVYQAFAGSKLVISATVTDNVGIKSATLYYRAVGAETWETAEMTNNNDKYSAIIPMEYMTTAGVEYYIDATDGITHTYKGTESEPYVITVQEPVDDSQKGDVDGNGAIELKDALMVLMAINDRLNLTQTEFTKADLDGDGELAAYEALRIIQYVNGTISSVLP